MRGRGSTNHRAEGRELKLFKYQTYKAELQVPVFIS